MTGRWREIRGAVDGWVGRVQKKCKKIVLKNIPKIVPKNFPIKSPQSDWPMKGDSGGGGWLGWPWNEAAQPTTGEWTGGISFIRGGRL